MYKKTVVILVLILISNLIFACDLCSIYIGLDPNGKQNTFGVRYRYRIFEKDYYRQSLNNASIYTKQRKGQPINKHGEGSGQAINNSEKYTFSETYNSYDVFTKFYLSQRLQVNLSTYFSDNYVFVDDSLTTNVAGIGDLSVILKYQLYNTKKCSVDSLKNKFIHRVTVGGGVDLPTGKYNKSTVTGFETEFNTNTTFGAPIEELDPHLQAGTGGFGYLFLFEYMTKFNKFGFNGNVSCKISTTNNNDFRFANRYNANGSLFFVTKLSKKIRIMPFIGSSFETSKRDTQDQNNVLGSGGCVTFFNGGLNIFINKISIEFSYYTPIYEELLDNQALNKNRMITQLAYYF